MRLSNTSPYKFWLANVGKLKLATLMQLLLQPIYGIPHIFSSLFKRKSYIRLRPKKKKKNWSCGRLQLLHIFCNYSIFSNSFLPLLFLFLNQTIPLSLPLPILEKATTQTHNKYPKMGFFQPIPIHIRLVISK